MEPKEAWDEEQDPKDLEGGDSPSFKGIPLLLEAQILKSKCLVCILLLIISLSTSFFGFECFVAIKYNQACGISPLIWLIAKILSDFLITSISCYEALCIYKEIQRLQHSFGFFVATRKRKMVFLGLSKFLWVVIDIFIIIMGKFFLVTYPGAICSNLNSAISVILAFTLFQIVSCIGLPVVFRFFLTRKKKLQL